MATRCLVADIFPQIKFENITLRTVGDPQIRFVSGSGVGHLPSLENPDQVSTKISLNCYLREQISAAAHPWYQQEDILSLLRLRVITCLGPHNPSSLDYISQRMNEYLHFSGSFDPPVTPQLFVKKIHQALGYRSQTINGKTYPLEKGQYLIGADTPTDVYRPYDTSDPILFIPDSYKSYRTDPNGEMMRDIILYDQALADILPRNEDGELKKRRVTEFLPDFRFGEDTREVVFEDAYLPPIEMTIGPDTDVGYDSNDLENISVYAFIYLDYDNFLTHYNFEPDENTVHTTLITGVGQTTSITPLGNQYVYNPITENTPYTARTLSEVNQSPDAGLLHDLRLQSFPDYSADLFNLHDYVFQSREGSSLERSPIGKSILKDDAFSDLWITKDTKENARYMFSFSLTNFLLERSQFPTLYANKDIAEKLLNGFEYEGKTYRSEVTNIRMSRQFVKPLSYIDNNNLGTYLRIKPEECSFTYPQTYIRTPAPTSLYLPSDPVSPGEAPIFGNTFYEGTDDFLNQKDHFAYDSVARKPERPGIYQYAAEVDVSDMSKIFLLKALKDIQKAKDELNRLLHFLLDTTFGHFDAKTRRFNRPLEEIPYNGSNAKVWATQHSINPYLEYLLLFRVPIPRLNMGVSPLGYLRNLLFQLLNSGVPEDLQEIVRTIEVLETNLAVTAGVYHTVQYGSQDEGSQKNAGLYQKGLYENNFPMLCHKHPFDELHGFGYKNGLGYSYVVGDEGEIYNRVGIGRVHRDAFQRRLRNEFNKYFYADPNQNVAPSQPFMQGGSAQAPAYQYLTPAYIFCPSYYQNEKRFSQITAQAEESLLGLRLDRYGELFSRLFKTYYGTEYLNFVFYNTRNEMTFDTPVRQTYNSLLQVLDEEYSCVIDNEVIKQFEVPAPKYFSDEVSPLTGLTEQGERAAAAAGATLDNRISLPQAILGGKGDQSSLTTTYYDTITGKYEQDKKDQETLEDNDINFHVPKDQNPPLKLTFGILGELEFDNTIDFHTFQDNPLNNMRFFGEILGVTSQTIETDINFTPEGLPNRLSHLPNQLKSMLGMAFSNEEIKINNSFNIKRSKLYDHDPVDRFANAISYHNENNINGNPLYSMVYDPMQVYAKFLSLWMNFKQLIKVEYFDGFGSTVGPVREQDTDDLINGNKPSMPIWRTLTKEVFDAVMDLSPAIASNKNNHLLCRVTIIDPAEFLPLSESSTDNALAKAAMMETLAKCFGAPEILNLPIYHKYFCIGPSAKVDPKEELRQMEEGG